MPSAKKKNEVENLDSNIIDPDKRSRRSSNPPPPSKPSRDEDDEDNEDRCAQPLPACSARRSPWLHHLLRSDEEEQGSDEEDGSDEEHVEATPAPRSSAKKAKPKTTPASSKAASRPARLPSTALAQPQNPAPPPT